eukprot:6738092-Lingulodinium_polyedra.AAC.1
MVVGPGGIEASLAKSNAIRAAQHSATTDAAPRGMIHVLVSRRTHPVGARSQAMAAPAAA